MRGDIGVTILPHIRGLDRGKEANMPVLSLLLISLSWFLFPEPSVSGVKIVTRQVTGLASDTRTEYLTANRLRTEWQARSGDRYGPPMASIMQRDKTSHVFVLDLQAHEYVSYDTDSQASLGVKPHPLAYSGGLLQIWIDSTDTGERLLMFGHMARHIKTREKRIASPGACSRSSQSETDGWYIDDSVMPEWHHPKKSGGAMVAVLVATGATDACFNKTDRLDVHRSGVEPGFPLKINTTITSEILGLDGTTRLVASNWGSEVTEFREEPLDPSLFEVPGDFHQVNSLKSWFSPAPRRQLTGWEWFKEKLLDIFR